MGCQSQKKKICKICNAMFSNLNVWLHAWEKPWFVTCMNLNFQGIHSWKDTCKYSFFGGESIFFYKFLEKIYMLTLLSRLCINIFNEYKYKKHLWNLHLYWKPKIRKKRKSTLISCMSVKFYAYICKKGQDNVSKLRDLFCVHE